MQVLRKDFFWFSISTTNKMLNNRPLCRRASDIQFVVSEYILEKVFYLDKGALPTENYSEILTFVLIHVDMGASS